MRREVVFLVALAVAAFGAVGASQGCCDAWWVCVREREFPCQPCYTLCMLGCVPLCETAVALCRAGTITVWGKVCCSILLRVGCDAACGLWICEYCGTCSACVEWRLYVDSSCCPPPPPPGGGGRDPGQPPPGEWMGETPIPC